MHSTNGRGVVRGVWGEEGRTVQVVVVGLGGQSWHVALAGVRVRDTALSCSLPQEFYGDYIAVNPHVFSLNLLGCCRVGAQPVLLSCPRKPGPWGAAGGAT